MGIEILEEKYHRYISNCPDKLYELREIALQVSQVQRQMRSLFDTITPQLCRSCQAPCCKCLPVEGWFTECDYFLYRMIYDPPFDLRSDHHDGKSCLFLGPEGCRLPPDMRPFPCVKVNCRRVTEVIERQGISRDFLRLNSELEILQDRVYPLLADIASPSVFYAQSYEPPVSV